MAAVCVRSAGQTRKIRLQTSVLMTASVMLMLQKLPMQDMSTVSSDALIASVSLVDVGVHMPTLHYIASRRCLCH